MKRLTRIIVILIAFSLVLIPYRMQAYADSMDNGVEINKENFSDPLFRNFMLNGSHMIWDENGNPTEVVYDANKDGWLSVEEAENIKQLLVMESYIRDLKGMEYLTELIEIDCQHSSVEKLYLENCPELMILNCYRAQLKGNLDLSGKRKLEGASCHNNRELTGIDTTGCVKLNSVTCGATGVTSLDLSTNPEIRFVSCEDTPITELDFSTNPELVAVSAYNSDLSDIDVSKNNKLEMMDVSNCKLTSLNVVNNLALIDLTVYGNDFAWFELGDKPALTVQLDNSTIAMEVTGSSFDITEVFPGINPAKVTIVSGASLEGSIVRDYTEGTPVVYTYECGTSADGPVVLNVTLNITGYEASVVPEEDRDPVTPEDDKNPVTPDEDKEPANYDSENAEPEKKTVETGDGFSPAAWLMLMGFAGSTILIVLRRKSGVNS